MLEMIGVNSGTAMLMFTTIRGGFAGSLQVTPSGKKHVVAETLSVVVALHAPAAPVMFELTRDTPGAIFSAASRIFW